MSTSSKPAKTTASTTKRGPVKKAPTKKTSSRSATAKAPAKPKPVTAKTVRSDTPVRPVLRKRELIDAVVRRSGVKKKDAKPVVEAMLAELGEVLAEGRELALQPLGRVKINREKPIPDGRVIVMKLRQKDTPVQAPAKATAAE